MNPAAPRLLGAATTIGTKDLYGIAFSPDGRLLATGSADRTVRLWQIGPAGRLVPIGAPLTGPTNKVYAVAFSPDGRQLSAVSTDGTLRSWDLSRVSRPQLSRVVQVSGDLYSLAYAERGTLVFTGGAASAIRAWRADPTKLRAQICARLGHDRLTSIGWEQYAPDAAQPPQTCPARAQ